MAAYSPRMRRDRRLGLLLLGAGWLPFAVGALVDERGLGPPLCPFRAVTGLPCPLCGATRAFAFAARGDGRLWQYNAPWVIFAVAVVLAGALTLARGRAPAIAARLTTPARVTASIALVLAVPWVYALTQRATIT